MKRAGKKTHWLRTTLIVLVVCALVGTIIAGIQFAQKKASTSVSATLLMTFNGAGDGVAPNGNRFDVQEMASDEVLQNALEAASLSDTYTPDQIRSSLRIQGSYPEDLEEQFTSYVSVLNKTGTGSQMLTMSDYHPTTFNIELSNQFDPAVSESALKSLLDCILSSYKTYFAASGAYKLETGSSVFNISDYDYVQQLNIIRVRLGNLAEYAKQMVEKNDSFLLNGNGYDSISIRIENLMTGDLNRIESRVKINALSKNKGRLLSQYQYEVQSLSNQNKYENENLEKLDKLIDAYQKNATIYVNTSDSLRKIDGNSSATYDQLVEQRKEIVDRMTEISSKLAKYKQLLVDLSGTEISEEQKSDAIPANQNSDNEVALTDATSGAIVFIDNNVEIEEVTQRLEGDIESLLIKERDIVADFDAIIQADNADQINDMTVMASSVRYSAPSFMSVSFLKQVLKTAGPFCALGLMVCLMMVFISKKREEKNQG